VALRGLSIIAVVAAVGLLLASSGSGEGATDRRSPCGSVELEPEELGLERARALTLCLLNARRAQHGLAPLRREGRLELASQRHSQDMVERRYFEHDDPGGVDPQDRILAAGYPAHNAITGENIAWGTGPKASPAQVVDLWMHSPPHRENILRSAFTEVGVGVAPGAPATPRSTDPPATYTTDFGGPPVR
jgi:Cysteine-rich secretory protein family